MHSAMQTMSHVLSSEAWVHANQGGRGHNSGTFEWTSGLPQDTAVWIRAHEPSRHQAQGGGGEKKKSSDSTGSKKIVTVDSTIHQPMATFMTMCGVFPVFFIKLKSCQTSMTKSDQGTSLSAELPPLYNRVFVRSSSPSLWARAKHNPRTDRWKPNSRAGEEKSLKEEEH